MCHIYIKIINIIERAREAWFRFGFIIADITKDNRRNFVVRVFAGALFLLFLLATMILIFGSVVIGISLAITIMAYIIAYWR